MFLSVCGGRIVEHDGRGFNSLWGGGLSLWEALRGRPEGIGAIAMYGSSVFGSGVAVGGVGAA